MRTLLRLAFLVPLLLAACPKRVMVNGQEMNEEEADSLAYQELARARAESARLAPQDAAARFEAIATRFGDVPASADALYEGALRWRVAGRPDRADAALSKLLTRMPLSARAPQAKFQLAVVETDTGRPREALASLTSLYDKLPPSDRPEAAREAARAAEAAHLWPQAVRWRQEAAQLSQGEERAKQQARALELLDGQLTFPEVAKLREELPANSPLLPAATMKLARIQLHLGDAAAAERSAREVVARWPDSPFAQDARALADRLSRRSLVSARAVGVAVPLSGKLKPWGEAVLQGVSLALGEGDGFKVVVKDTRGEPEGAQVALDELAQGEGVIAALGGVVNAEAPRAASAAQAQGLPFISLARVEGVTQAGPFVFRNMLTAEAQAKALAELAMARRGMRRFALLWPQIPYGQELAMSFWDEIDARGGEVRAAESYDHDRTTFAPVVKSMVGKLWLDERQDYVEQAREIAKEEADPFRRRKALEKLRERLPPVTDFDAVFIPDFAKNIALVAPALAVEDVVTQTCDPREVERIKKVTGREDLRPVQLLGANGWDDPALLEKAGKYVECAIFVDGFYSGSERPDTKAFVAAFQAKYAHPPSILEASAYDAARMIRRALEGGAATRDALREQLSALKGFPGATGELAFDARREVAKQLFYITVDKGALRELTPQELAAPGVGGS
jgi:ABC-type branched-subunit amino acid transport system substrate-binding protein